MIAESGHAFVQALLKAREADDGSLKELAMDHLPLVAAMVKRFSDRAHEPQELYQQGCVGLMKALARFDPTFGVTFSTYAASMILGEMHQLCRQDCPVHVPRTDREKKARIRKAKDLLTSQLGREPTLHELSALLRITPEELVFHLDSITVCSLDEPANGKKAVNALYDLVPARDDWETRVLLRDLLDHLSGRDKRLILLRFRFGLTQRETAERLHMTQVQVSRVETAVKAKLRSEWMNI